VPFTVVLDACVLYPIVLCDLLLRLSLEGIYSARWTDEILQEAERNVAKRKGVDPDTIHRRFEQIRTAFEHALVEGYEELAQALSNSTPDAHVVAAAVVAGAQVVVTDNLRHFPADLLRKYNMEAQRADDFLMHQLSLSQNVVLDVLEAMAASKKNPPLEISDLLDALEKRAPNFARSVRTLATDANKET